MEETIKLLDVVALTVDLPEHNLWRGQVGTVVEVLKTAPPLRLSLAIVTGGHMNRSAYAWIK